MSNNSTTRSTGYEWVTNAEGNVIATIIPGNNRKLAGWIQQTWTTREISSSGGWSQTSLEMFGADGQLVQKKTENNSAEPSKTPDKSILWDRNGRIVSDFSPYDLTDQLTSYYGFESYEMNNSSSPFRWRFSESNVLKGGFALTGENYLRLNASHPLLEGVFTPADQDLTYVASCWIRPSNGIDYFVSTTEQSQVTPYLKAIISVNETGEEIVGLLGRIIRSVGDWAYLEVLINFNFVKRLYAESQLASKKEKTPQFTIKLTVDADQHSDGHTAVLDVDHVRFSPVLHDFKATVFNSDNGRPVSVIGSSGSISRTIYYRDREMAVVTDVTVNGQQQVEQVATSSYTGRLIPTPNGSPSIVNGAKRSRTVFYPENGGLYEIFDAYAWKNRWNDSTNNLSVWTTAPARLWHNHQQSHQLVSVDPSTLFGAESSSAAIRCYYSLISPTASMTWKMAGGQVRLARKSEKTSSTLTFQVQPDTPHTNVTDLPNSGEIIMMTEGGRFFIWIDSVLLLDRLVASLSAKNPWTFFAFEAQGNTFVEDCIFMGNPRTEMEYMNEWGEKMQTIQLESDRSVLVSQTLYDELGREGIITKLTRVSVDEAKPLLTYYSDFVSGPIDPENSLSVWKTHRLRGMVDRLNPLDKGVPYFRTEYEANPLNEKRVEGQPGPDFTVNGSYAKKFGTSAGGRDEIAVIDNHFPTSKGFRHKMEEMPNGTKRVAVLDQQENRVALYIYVLGHDHLLSTYEYDSKNRLIKILPPIYHERADTFMKSKPLWPVTKTKLSSEEIHLQKTLGTFMTYNDDTGLLIHKTTPDTGHFEYYYNRDGLLRLQVHSVSEESNEIDSVVFYEYDDNGRAVARTGFLEQMPMSREKFKNSLAEGSLANANFYQLIDRTEAEERHYDPSLLRGERNATFVTHNFDDNVLVEEMRWDSQDRLIESKQLVSFDQPDTEIRKTYYSHSNRLRSIQYPSVSGENNLAIKLEHRYNKLGKLIALSLDGQSGDIVRFNYHGSGQLASEHVFPGSQHSFNRTFNYNSPGFLEQISDPFLTELVSYTDGGYGQGGTGDGIVMRTAFNATWPPNADWRWFQLTNHSKLMLESNSSAQLCFKALKRNGYLTKTGRPLKDYHFAISDGKTWMPLVCGGPNGQQMARILAQKRMPRIYGHSYAYGNHRELVKAKYFTDETEKLAVPFQPDTLSRQTALNKQQSRDVWKQLDDAGFIVSDQRKSDWLTAVANPGKSFTRSDDLKTLLAAVTGTQEDVKLYRNLIEKMILKEIGQRRNKLSTLDEFQKIFLQWSGFDDGMPFADSEKLRRVAEKVHQVMGKAKDTTDWLDVKLRQIFNAPQYSKYLADFIRILDQHFTYALGEHPFDVASFDIDANGNHKKFYTGFHRYEFSYDDDKANRIRSIKVEEIGKLDVNTATDKTMLHDTRGNVIQALHKGIERIEYNDASMRTTAIHLTDGRTVRFAYDAHGERILKRVMAKDGHLIHEAHYARDTEGKVLFDRRTTYSSTSSSLLPELKDAAAVVVSTSYIYGPRGLLGFVRNGAFHSVWTDHSGSIRLVLRDGQVVAAYDYLPYGQLMRSYGNDPAAEIFYRYTGQEWDGETGLYNYHARFYDPDIGRFYQPDPREQYFSPYKYVGNSPVSLVDPDGEFGLLIGLLIGLFAVGGAYLGGAAANNNWNPGKWNWKSGKTWAGIIGGGIGGAMIPIGAVAATAAIGIHATVAVGFGTAYVSAAAANNNADFTKWKWDEPGTYNALFQGISTGMGIVGGGAVAHQFANTFGKLGKFSILRGTYTTAAGFAYGKAVSANNGEFAPWKWDWTNLNTLNALLEGVDSGIGLPTDLTQMGHGILKLAKNSPKQLSSLLPMLKKFKLKQLKPLLKSIAKGLTGKVAAAAVTAYLMTSMANENFDPSGWDANSFATYEGFLNGLTFGTSARNMLKAGNKQFRHLKAKANNALKVKLPKLVTKMRFDMGRAFDNIRSGKIQRWIKHNLFQLKTTRKLLLSKDGLQFSINKISGNKLLELPDAQKVALHRLETLEDTKNRMRNRENEAFADREMGSFGCRPGLRKRRMKRGNSNSKCPIAFSDTELQAQLNKDPVSVLKNSPISTRKLVNPKQLFRGFQNGGTYKFELYPENGQASYSLIAKPISLNDPTSVQGYWLNTNEKIQIDPFGETRFIFTQELQSCSIYVKYDYDFIGKDRKHEPKMTVFHHNRDSQFGIYLEEGHYQNDRLDKIIELDGALELFDKSGNVLHPKDGAIVPLENIYRKDHNGNFEEIKEINKEPIQDIIKKNLRLKQIEDDLAAEYDTVIRYEDYLAFTGHHNNVMHSKGLPITFSTPILYRDITDGQWYFASKKNSFSNMLDNEAKFLPKLWNDAYIQFKELKSENNKGNLNSILDFRRLYEFGKEKVDLYIRKLDTIPLSQEEAVSLGSKKFPNRQQFKDYVQSLKSASSSESKLQPARRSRWSEQIGVRDVERAQNKRDRRSVLLLDTRNTTHPLQCQSTKEETYLNENTLNYSYPTSAPYLVSSASRPASWIDLISSITVSRQLIATIASLDSIFDFVTVSLRLPDVPIESIRPNQFPQNHEAVDLLPQLDDVSQTDYRDVSIGNCYSYSTNAITCYGHHGQTMVFTQSPSVDISPPPLKQDKDTFHDCRPIEWHGQPSVTCLGDETTFIHSPYNRNSVAEKFVVAVDSWLILAYAAPGIYREISKMACHVKNVIWTGSVCKIPVPINDEDKQLWKMQLDKLEEIVRVQLQSNHQVDWAFPLIIELQEQISSLSSKTIAETMDDVRALKTMTERLSALIEDIEEMTHLGPTEHDEEDGDIIFYDCFEDDCSVEKETTNGYIKNAESISAQLHHFTRSMSACAI
ncbi:uncharacterized protein LOC124336627 [Daphnia pulicaria]|uniref:uncharacterized protein LOC124336627 n=1 Tax=Daphnia pulicaria TaxID=35523 RepID=UPI001EEC48EE|nr:uncharacterized protein LOC124336627 [Daphnia pulicaria]XP_046646366.1 uncharacterized protein LOC124336627 [Daphnia pulicaria]XP_046646367.1 uncharacterized protein LOC124336627 [Daphnia pulicaria]